MILDTYDTDIDMDWSDRDAVVTVCIVSDMNTVMDCPDRNVVFMVYSVSDDIKEAWYRCW